VIDWSLVLKMVTDINHVIVDFFWNTIYELTVAIISYKIIVKKLEKRFVEKNKDESN
jgi:ascorbate-specific PTS system EIIC-type component UlaA